jgi:hypothetical protein
MVANKIKTGSLGVKSLFEPNKARRRGQGRRVSRTQ